MTDVAPTPDRYSREPAPVMPPEWVAAARAAADQAPPLPDQAVQLLRRTIGAALREQRAA